MNIRLDIKIAALLCILIGAGCFLDAARRRTRRSIPVTQAEIQKPGIAVPKAGQTYSIGYLFDLINTNNPQKTSHFLVPAAGGDYVGASFIKHSECWPANGPHLTMGKSAAYPPISLNTMLLADPMKASDPDVQEEYKDIRNTQVTLQADPVLINKLLSDGRLTTRDNISTRYGTILLYFVYTADDGNQYRLYINDPLPAKIVRTATVERNPAKLILDKWAI